MGMDYKAISANVYQKILEKAENFKIKNKKKNQVDLKNPSF